jgi:hypothetical protein
VVNRSRATRASLVSSTYHNTPDYTIGIYYIFIKQINDFAHTARKTTEGASRFPMMGRASERFDPDATMPESSHKVLGNISRFSNGR